MTEKTQIRRSDLADLDRAITRRYPSLPKNQVRTVRSRIMEYVANGLADGFDVALIKPISDEEIRIKVLTLQKERKVLALQKERKK